MAVRHIIASPRETAHEVVSHRQCCWALLALSRPRACHTERGENHAQTESLFPPWVIHLWTNERVSFVTRDCVRQRRCRARPSCHGRTVGPGPEGGAGDHLG